VIVIYIPWLVLTAVWVAGALTGKKTVRREAVGERNFHIAGTALAFLLEFGGPDGTRSEVRHAIGFAVCVAGIALAIWARVLLGTNWSGLVTLKEGHELIRRGPYRFVRHPIYSGALLGLLGTAIWFGQAWCFAGLAVASFTWWKKSRIEERFLVDLFGDRYREYQREVRALIPGLL
jgi:protein-S-isoprenylcysteine O-methyltransferase Ste14